MKCSIEGCNNEAERIERPLMSGAEFCRHHFDEIYEEEVKYREIHREHIVRGQAKTGNKGGRPRIELKDYKKTVERLKREPFTAVAALERMSPETLRRRLKELEDSGKIKKGEKWSVVE